MKEEAGRKGRRPGLAVAAILVLSLGVATAIVLAARHSQRGPATTGAERRQPVEKQAHPRTAATTRLHRPPPPHDSPVPILMYHAIATPPAGAPYPGLFVSPTDFSAQVRLLAAHGFHAVTLRQVYRYWMGIESLPPRPVVFSFDDGYRSVYLNALPVLRAHDWPGVVDIVVKNMSVPWGLSRRLLGKLIASGWEIDSHTMTHPNLTILSPNRLEHEVTGSRAFLETSLRVAVDFFCYPSGRYDSRVVDAVKAAGYLGAVTTVPGLARPNDLFELARVRVTWGEGADGLAAELRAFGEPL